MAAFTSEQLRGTIFGDFDTFPITGHMPNCNCGTGDFGCVSQNTRNPRRVAAGTFSIVIEANVPPPDPLLPPYSDFYWPPGCPLVTDKPVSRTTRRRWREYAHARRHARHDRAPPILAAE